MHQLKLGLVSHMTDASLLSRSFHRDENREIQTKRKGGSLTWRRPSHPSVSVVLPWPPGGSHPEPRWVLTAEGWPRSHGHRLTLLFTARACLTAAPEMGNIAHLARLLGAVMPQRPVLWQAINVPREKQRESD